MFIASQTKLNDITKITNIARDYCFIDYITWILNT